MNRHKPIVKRHKPMATPDPTENNLLSFLYPSPSIFTDVCSGCKVNVLNSGGNVTTQLERTVMLPETMAAVLQGPGTSAGREGLGVCSGNGKSSLRSNTYGDPVISHIIIVAITFLYFNNTDMVVNPNYDIYKEFLKGAPQVTRETTQVYLDKNVLIPDGLPATSRTHRRIKALHTTSGKLERGKVPPDTPHCTIALFPGGSAIPIVGPARTRNHIRRMIDNLLRSPFFRHTDTTDVVEINTSWLLQNPPPAYLPFCGGSH